jgi:hypothetical protein
MAGSQKKVIVRPFNTAAVSGYMPACGFLESNVIALMDTGGKAILFPINEIKWIAYVRDFNTSDLLDPERIGRRTFPARPRAEGLWLHMTFRDGDILQGLAPLDLTFLDAIVTDHGLTVAPPDLRSNTQRIYVPRPALAALDLLGVVTSASSRKAAAKPATDSQPTLFG